MTASAFAPSSRLADVRPSPIREVFDRAAALERAGRSIVHFEIGRPDFDTPLHIKQAAAAALDAGLVHYAPNRGVPELLSALSDSLWSAGMGYAADSEIVVTVGANEAVFASMMAHLDPGDEVLIPTPAWPHYPQCCRLAGGVPVPIQLSREDGYEIDPDAIRRALNRRTRMVVLASPHNPTGAVTQRERLEALSEVLDGTRVLVLADEIYGRLVYDDATHIPVPTIPGMRSRTLLVGGFAKAFAMDGWRMGYLAAPTSLVEPALRVHQYVTVCAPTFLQHGAVAALRGSQEPTSAMVAEFAARRGIAISVLASSTSVTTTPTRGAFYLWLEYGTEWPAATELAIDLLEEAGVALVPGKAFGDEADRSFRLAYSCPRDDVAQGCQGIVDFFERRRA